MTFLADGKAQLVIGHDNAAGLLAGDQGNAQYIRRAEGCTDILTGIFVPYDDIDLLTAQFFHNSANTAASGADTSAHGIHALHSGTDGHLGTGTGLTGDILDLHHAGLDLRYLHLKETLDQTGMGTGNGNEGALGLAVDLGKVNLDALTLANLVSLETWVECLNLLYGCAIVVGNLAEYLALSYGVPYVAILVSNTADALLLILLLLYFTMVYYVRPIYRMSDGIDAYRLSSRRYLYEFDGDDQLANINTGLTEIIDENVELKRRSNLSFYTYDCRAALKSARTDPAGQ